jgi:uncharacterized membrane protein (TIGR02234 family)
VTWPRRRRTVVVLALVLGASLLALGALPWVRATVRTVIDVREIAVSGATATPALTAAALVVGAAAVTIGIGRRVGAAVGGVALLGAAVLAGTAVAGVLGNPAAPALAAAAELSGVPQLAGEVHVTAWPWVALVVAACLALLGIVALVAGGRWQAAGRRFERPGAPSARSASSEASDARTRAMDDWDALGRGEDPSGQDPSGQDPDGSGPTGPGSS